ncbi:hypothetical protein BG006_002959 [Podila minutissima]|uniref:Uncharacterized protein n=1 Tax=Podila minutissima TaxID=64525 RepID=A0A9P5VNR0_9FUNG|nr:hypothetical protein BG006_002959 [Podila minutissima]
MDSPTGKNAIDTPTESRTSFESKPGTLTNASHSECCKESELVLEIHRRLRKNYSELKDLPALLKEIEDVVRQDPQASFDQRVSAGKLLSVAKSRVMVASAVVNLIENVVTLYEEHSLHHGSGGEMAEMLLKVLQGANQGVDLDRREDSVPSQSGSQIYFQHARQQQKYTTFPHRNSRRPMSQADNCALKDAMDAIQTKPLLESELMKANLTVEVLEEAKPSDIKSKTAPTNNLTKI